MQSNTALAVVGATASGKSTLALALAKRLNGELICMDSMQIYRHMDVGTAKPTREERLSVPHHMLDVVEPTQSFTVAAYADMARPVVLDVLSRKKTPILVGGTGLYLRALMHGMALGGAKSDEALRAKYHAMADEPGGRERLHALLAKCDPLSAAKLHPNDLRRVIRALEVYDLTGAPISRQPEQDEPQPFRVVPIGLTLPREQLYGRINRRVLDMLAQGLVDEVRALLAMGVTQDMQSMQGIGYKELIPVVRHGVPLGDAAVLIQQNTRHYAKRQGAFFRTEPLIRWLDVSQGDALEGALALME